MIHSRDKDSVVSHREAEKARLDSLLVDNRKNLLLATGVFNKVGETRHREE